VATVDGMTLARLLALEAGTVIDGAIDGSGHLILTTHDGTEIDAGYALVAVPGASTTVQGVVELATTAEVEAHTNVFHAVTPDSLATTIARIDGHDEKHLTPASYTQASLITDYPMGISYLYMSDTQATTGGWEFGGMYGLVTTYKYSGDYIVQLWQKHQGGTSGLTDLWQRTANSPSGWSNWIHMASTTNPATMGITGEMKMWPAASAPSGWMLCEGGAISRTTFAALFALIGTTYGVGDGTTTFNVPDMRGRVPTGFDSTQTEFNARGKTGGEKTHTLTTAEIPSHNHTQTAHSHDFPNGGNGALTNGGGSINFAVQNGTFYGFKAAQPGATTAVNQVAGGGGAHNVLQPYLTIKYIIKT
jgi:microcystin-dependent protein